MTTKTWIILQAVIVAGLITNWFLLDGWAYRAAASILIVLSVVVAVERTVNAVQHYQRFQEDR